MQKEVCKGSHLIPPMLAVIKILLATFLLVYLAFATAKVLLLIFAGILIAIFLVSISAWLPKILPISKGWSLLTTCLLLLGLAVGIGFWMAPSIGEQLDELIQRLPQSIQSLRSQLESHSWTRPILRYADPEQLFQSGQQILSNATGIVSGFFGAIAGGVIIFFFGIYGAAEPHTYQSGLIRLLPKHHRERMESVLKEMVYTLKWWLLGKVLSMILIGILTTIGLWLLGIPLALILGVIAAVLTFIPNIGPTLSAVPAVLLGFVEGPEKALYIILLYLGIQAVETYLVTPLIQRKTINMPPALVLASQIMLGWIFGILGIALATPITAVAIVATKRLYVEDTLGDEL